ncbi:MAG: hypothetical protein R2780_02235 [Crocinitomicaceae bacterium]|nr:hypothetical protein [Crocinitomicaceae bacterium]
MKRLVMTLSFVGMVVSSSAQDGSNRIERSEFNGNENVMELIQYDIPAKQLSARVDQSDQTKRLIALVENSRLSSKLKYEYAIPGSPSTLMKQTMSHPYQYGLSKEQIDEVLEKLVKSE